MLCYTRRVRSLPSGDYAGDLRPVTAPDGRPTSRSSRLGRPKSWRTGTYYSLRDGPRLDPDAKPADEPPPPPGAPSAHDVPAYEHELAQVRSELRSAVSAGNPRCLSRGSNSEPWRHAEKKTSHTGRAPAPPPAHPGGYSAAFCEHHKRTLPRAPPAGGEARGGDFPHARRAPTPAEGAAAHGVSAGLTTLQRNESAPSATGVGRRRDTGDETQAILKRLPATMPGAAAGDGGAELQQPHSSGASGWLGRAHQLLSPEEEERAQHRRRGSVGVSASQPTLPVKSGGGARPGGHRKVGRSTDTMLTATAAAQRVTAIDSRGTVSGALSVSQARPEVAPWHSTRRRPSLARGP